MTWFMYGCTHEKCGFGDPCSQGRPVESVRHSTLVSDLLYAYEVVGQEDLLGINTTGD